MQILHSIQARFAAGQLVRVMSFGALAHPKLVEIAAQLGDIHGIWIDQEHCAIPHAQLELLLMACRAGGLDAFARVAPTDYATIMRPMEAGCSGIMAAQVRTREEVQQIVRWAKYPPQGVRGLFMSNAESKYGTVGAAEHVIKANAERWIAIQIETAEAVEIVDQIAGTAGVDWLFVGPADLSSALGVPGEVLHPKCLEALDQVAQACRRHGKPWGTLSRDPRHAVTCRKLGCQLFSLVGDMDLVHRGFVQTKQMFAEFFDAT